MALKRNFEKNMEKSGKKLDKTYLNCYILLGLRYPVVSVLSLVTDVGTERWTVRDAEETRSLERVACRTPGRKNVL